MLIDQILYNILYMRSGGPAGKIYTVCNEEFYELTKDVNNGHIPLGLIIMHKENLYIFLGSWKKFCLCDNI